VALEELWDELNSSDAAGIRRALELHPTQVTFNRARKAVQVLGCNDTVVGHLTLSEKVAAALLKAGKPDTP
jgi:hypothetical protein